MSVLDGLAACAGNWQGTNILQDPEIMKPDESSSTATVTQLLGGRFVRLDYTWSYHGKPQEGSLLIGFDPGSDALTAHWIDTWHMSNKVMAFAGPKPNNATLIVRGSYEAPPGPDWGWRIEITPDSKQTLAIKMYNIWPEGREDLVVEASYSRA